MSETTLKRLPTEKEVDRLRNLIQGKYGDKSTVSSGYEKQNIDYKEGDIWEEDGKTWTIKNNIKQNITKLDKAKEFIVLPLFCPCCKKIMKKKTDKAFYYQYNRCTDCQIDFETELKSKGLWDTYERNIINTDIDNLINDFDIWFNEVLNQGEELAVYENGNIEKWVGSAKEKLLKNREETIKFLQNLKK